MIETALDAFTPAVVPAEVFDVDLIAGDIYLISRTTGKRRKLTTGLAATIFRASPRGVAFAGAGVDSWVPYIGGDIRPTAFDTIRATGLSSSFEQNQISRMAVAFAATFGVNDTKNLGGGGQNVRIILARSTRPIKNSAPITFPAGSTAAVPVSQTEINPTNATVSYPARIEGTSLTGVFSKRIGTTSQWQFALTTALGAPVAVPAGRKIIGTDCETYRNGFVRLGTPMKNDATQIFGYAPMDAALAMFGEMARQIGTVGGYYSTLTMYKDRGMDPESVAARNIDKGNAWIKAYCAGHVYDTEAFIASPNIWALTGITMQPEDYAAQQVCTLPPRLSESDGLHLVALARKAIEDAHTIWFATKGCYPVAEPAVPG